MSRIDYSQLITDSAGGKSTSRSFIFDLPNKEELDGAPRHAAGQTVLLKGVNDKPEVG